MSDMQTVYCVPIEETGDDIKEDPVVQIPLDNMFSQEEATNTMLRMLLNFIGIAIIIIFTMVGTPYAYKIFISNIIKNVTWNQAVNIGGGEHDKINRLKISEMWAFGTLFLTGLFMLTGFATNDQFGAMVGIFLITLLFIAFARIQFEKQFNDKYSGNKDGFYMELLGINPSSNANKTEESMFYPLLNILNTWKNKGNPWSMKWGLLIIFYVIEIIATSLIYTKTSTAPSGSLFIIFWFPIYLTSFIFSMMEKPVIEDPIK